MTDITGQSRAPEEIKIEKLSKHFDKRMRRRRMGLLTKHTSVGQVESKGRIRGIKESADRCLGSQFGQFEHALDVLDADSIVEVLNSCGVLDREVTRMIETIYMVDVDGDGVRAQKMDDFSNLNFSREKLEEWRKLHSNDLAGGVTALKAHSGSAMEKFSTLLLALRGYDEQVFVQALPHLIDRTVLLYVDEKKGEFRGGNTTVLGMIRELGGELPVDESLLSTRCGAMDLIEEETDEEDEVVLEALVDFVSKRDALKIALAQDMPEICTARADERYPISEDPEEQKAYYFDMVIDRIETKSINTLAKVARLGPREKAEARLTQAKGLLTKYEGSFEAPTLSELKRSLSNTNVRFLENNRKHLDVLMNTTMDTSLEKKFKHLRVNLRLLNSLMSVCLGGREEIQAYLIDSGDVYEEFIKALFLLRSQSGPDEFERIVGVMLRDKVEEGVSLDSLASVLREAIDTPLPRKPRKRK